MLDRPSAQHWFARLVPAPFAARAVPLLILARSRLEARRFALVAGAAVLSALAALTALSLAGAIFGWLALAALAVTVAPEPMPMPAQTMAQPRAEGANSTRVWRSLVDAVPDAALVLDRQGSIVHFNARVSALYPAIRDGVPLSMVVRNPDLLGAVERLARDGGAVSVAIVERTPVELRFEAVVATLADGAVASGGAEESAPYALVVFRDVTEQERLAAMRADFIANASHELRTPLASLRGFVETLQGAARNDEKARERFLGLMGAQATRMTRLIDDLLSLSRIEMSAHIPPQGRVDVNEVAAHVAQTLQPLADEARIGLHVTPAQREAVIAGARDEIVQVAANLVQNAIKYGREGGRVDIVVTRSEAAGGARGRVTLAVADDGRGIAPEHLPRLTERFYRVSVVDSRDKGGTGLGLAIVKHIVGRHRGELKIESKVGVGSTFAASFDVADAARKIS